MVHPTPTSTGLLVAGLVSLIAGPLAGLTADPQLDHGFGHEGIRQLNNALSQSFATELLVVDNDETFRFGAFDPGAAGLRQAGLTWLLHADDGSPLPNRYGADHERWPVALGNQARSAAWSIDGQGRVLLAWTGIADAADPADPTTPVTLQLLRLLPDGTIDADFGRPQRQLGTLAEHSRVQQVVDLPTGSMLLLQRRDKPTPGQERHFAEIHRLDGSGAWLADYGNAGVARIDVEERSLQLVTILPTVDGGCWLAGTTGALEEVGGGLVASDETRDGLVGRLDAGGQLDAGFDDDGLLIIDRHGYVDEIDLLLPDATGAIYATGRSADGPALAIDTVRRPFVVACDATGLATARFDLGFRDLDEDLRVVAAATDPAGALQLAGNRSDGADLLQLRPDGTLDPAFGSDGRFRFEDRPADGLIAAVSWRIDDLHRLASGELLVVVDRVESPPIGDPILSSEIWRLSAAGSLDDGWNGGEALPVAFIPSTDRLWDLSLADDEPVLSTWAADDGQQWIHRLRNDGATQAGFGEGDGNNPLGFRDPTRPVIIEGSETGDTMVVLDSSSAPLIARLTPAGAADETWSGTGAWPMAGVSADGRVADISIRQDRATAQAGDGDWSIEHSGPDELYWLCGWDVNETDAYTGWIACRQHHADPFINFNDGFLVEDGLPVRFLQIHPQADDAVFVFGETTVLGPRELLIMRYYPFGAIDDTFGIAGGLRFATADDLDVDFVDGMQHDNRWFVLGQSDDGADHRRLVLGRCDLHGDPDSLSNAVLDLPDADCSPIGFMPVATNEILILLNIDRGDGPAPYVWRCDTDLAPLADPVALASLPVPGGQLIDWLSDATGQRFYVALEAAGDIWLQRYLLSPAVNNSPVPSPAEPVMRCDEDPTPDSCQLTVQATDADEIDRVSWTMTALPAQGDLRFLPGDGAVRTLVYQPPADFFGELDAELTCRDSAGASVVVPLRIVVTAVNDPPIILAAPSLLGPAIVGEVLYSTDADASDPHDDPALGPLPSYQWFRASDASGTGATAIAGATGASYQPTANDRGSFIQLRITYTDQGIGEPANLTAETSSDWLLVEDWLIDVDQVTITGTVADHDEETLQVDGADIDLTEDGSWQATTPIDSLPRRIPLRLQTDDDTAVDGIDLIIELGASTEIEGG